MAANRDVLIDTAAVVVAVAAVVIAGTSVASFVSGRSPGAGSPPGRFPPEQIENWDAVINAGHRRGPEEADVTVVVFSDFQCPACGNFARNIFPLFAAEHPGQVALIHRHWPLTSHPQAYAAAIASECAAVQRQFWDFHDSVFADQAQLGLRSMIDIGASLGIADMDAFGTCVEELAPRAIVDRDVDLVRSLGGTGTPTVIVNGWILRGGVDAALLDSITAQYWR